MALVRPPAVAGLFYPSEARTLASAVDDFVAAASVASDATTAPKALIVPHAGYRYSGAMAGRGYASVAPLAGTITRVILLGPVHRVPVRGLALPGADALLTPLGEVRVEASEAADLPGVVVRPDVHAAEHSLEVQLPFLQRVLGNVALVPLAVGDASAAEVASVLDPLWGGAETLIVVSTDLSHYHPYAQAQRRDAATLEAVLALAGPLTHDQACGATPLNGLLHTARRRGMNADLLGACNSGDTAGDRARVVGYASVALTEAA